jgi:hypothetical protein
VNWFIVPCLWKVIFLWDFRICLVLMNTEVISHIIPCGVVPSYWHFGGAVLDDFLALKMKALCSSRTLVTLYQSVWINIPEDLNSQCSVGCVRLLPNLNNEIPSLVCWVYEACTLVPLIYYFIVLCGEAKFITLCNWASAPWRLHHIQLQCFTRMFIFYLFFWIYEICLTFLLQCLCMPFCCDCQL